MQNEWENEDFLMAQSRLLSTAKRLGLDDNVISPLKQPKRSIAVVLPINLDKGDVKSYWGYRVQYDLALGLGQAALDFIQE